MSKTQIVAPTSFTGVGAGGVLFKDGVGHSDNPAVLDYCRSAGYQVGPKAEPLPLTADEIDEAVRRVSLTDPDLDPDEVRDELATADPDRVRKVLAEPVDPRDLDGDGISPVGTRLRDASVDPEPTDFLAPTNAGEANPHGPLVVAPGIHGIETQVVRPGQVYVEDLAKQDAAETAQAQALLVERKPVDEVVPQFVRGDENGEGGSDTGPLGLSDPGSVVAIDTGDTTDEEKATLPDGTSVEPPAASASKGAWTAYARTQGATDADLEGKTRDQLRDLYAPTV